MRSLPLVAFVILSAAATMAAQTPVVTFAGETMRLRSASVTAAGGGAFNVSLVVENDNANASLATTWRRWWHCEISAIQPAGATLVVTVDSTNGYADVILPVWALSSDGGATFGPYARCPLAAVPQVLTNGRHRFTLQTPVGTNAIRLAKYFPYSVTRKDAWLQSIAGDPRVRSISVLGNSVQGRPIHLVELTDATRSDVGKKRIWIHAGIHPAETTSYFTVEGLVAWLRSSDPYAAVLLDHAIIDIVPMANPDGVFLGNYRTNANSQNLEDLWSPPYNNSQPEIIALRTRIEQLMGTPAAPGSNPITVLFNLHSSHNVDYPFHFQHTANASWSPGSSGVIPLVNQIEGTWIGLFRARSAFASAGTTQSSSAGGTTRQFVESMMHDRWSAAPGWLPPAGGQDPVMAITFEGTYGLGPDLQTWNTEAHYRQCGAEMGLALCDHLGLGLSASLQTFGAPCTSVAFTGTLAPLPSGSHQATLLLGGTAPNALCWLLLGFQRQTLQLPAPWQNCSALVAVDATATFLAGPLGIAQLPLIIPATPGLVAHFQVIAADLLQTPIPLDTSNGLTIQNNY